MAGAPHLEQFLAAAKYFVGIKESPDGSNRFTSAKGKEMVRLAGFGSGFAWCAAFVSACAQKAGVAGKVIEKQTGAGWLQQSTVLHCGGKWIDGPLMGKSATPMPGDIISFGDSKYHGHGHATHVGIVEYVDGGKVHTIEGNTGNACKRKSYSLKYSAINCYVRPDWSRVGDDVSAYLAGVSGAIGPLYQNRNDRHDMMIRQVGYLDANYGLTNSKTNIPISVINYTTVLGDIYNVVAAATMGGAKVSTEKLTGNTKIVVDGLLKQGFSGSAASAIAGSMKTYSYITPTFSKRLPNGKYLQGLCGWDDTKIPEVKDRLGYEWNINLTGQLEYFLYDFETNFQNLLVMIKNAALNPTSVENATAKMIANYNKHFATSAYIDEATTYALDIYNSLVITQAPIVGNTTVLKNKAGTTLKAKSSVTIPSSVPQTGIIDDYTSYSYFYHRWAKGTTQRTLANTWYSQGCPSSKGVATIGGYYCVAVKPKFGKCGDIIVINLEGGASFAAIISDVKGADAKSEWGHPKSGGKISIVEWERVKTQNGKVLTEGTTAAGVDKHGFGSWYGKKVLNITNYGKYL